MLVAAVFWIYISGVYWKAYLVYFKSLYSEKYWISVNGWIITLAFSFSIILLASILCRRKVSLFRFMISTLLVVLLGLLMPIFGVELAYSPIHHLTYQSLSWIVLVSIVYFIEIPISLCLLSVGYSDISGKVRHNRILTIISASISALIAGKSAFMLISSNIKLNL